MEVKDYNRAYSLLSYEETENKCSLYKLSEVFNNFASSSYFDADNFKRGNVSEVLKQIEIIQNKQKIFENKIEKVKQGKKYKDFIKQYKDTFSHYSMGESVEVHFTDGICRKYETIADRRTYYSRSLYNKNIKHGLYLLCCDISKDRTKYTLTIREKDM